MSLANDDSMQLESATARHASKVADVVRQLRAHDGSRPLSFKKKSVAHQVPRRNDARRADRKIDLSALDEILSVDPEARTCTAEPGVTFVDLVKATLRHGLVPTVVPELETITVGGAVSGCSIESMSFQHGGFHDSCLAYEVLTATGEIVTCTPTERSLVFQMVHGSFGTLGVLTKITFRLVPAKPYVHVVYESYATLAAYKAAIWRHYRAADVDFMDGIIHAADHYVLSVGRFVDRAPYTHTYDWVTVYYRTTAKRREDYLTTRDYFFRYDRGVTNPTPRSLLGRLLFGKVLDSTQLLRLAERMPRLLSADRPDVTVDLFLPFSRLDAYLAWHEQSLGHFPLWCVPYRVPRRYEWIAKDYLAGVDDELFVDIAIYGMKQPPGRNVYEELEAELLRVQGIKTLISHNHYDEDTFWRIYSRESYDAVKATMDPQNVFRDLYTKTCRATSGLP